MRGAGSLHRDPSGIPVGCPQDDGGFSGGGCGEAWRVREAPSTRLEARDMEHSAWATEDETRGAGFEGRGT
jgi:hypothetical protein